MVVRASQLICLGTDSLSKGFHAIGQCHVFGGSGVEIMYAGVCRVNDLYMYACKVTQVNATLRGAVGVDCGTINNQTMQKERRENAQTPHRQRTDNAQTTHRQCTDNAQTMHRQCTDNAQTMNAWTDSNAHATEQ